jgi:arylsulfatase A-like enzyme
VCSADRVASAWDLRRWGVLALALAALLPACRPERPKIVVWIEVDALRADALGCYGNTSAGEGGTRTSPHIDRLAREGVRFENALSAAPWTVPSLVTQMSGRWPFEHGVTRLMTPCPEAYLTFVPAMRERGWRTAGVMTNFVASGRFGFGHGFDRFDDSLARGHEGSTGNEAVERLLGFADELHGDPGEGLFLFAWIFEPHFRYEAHPGARFGPGYGDQAGTTYAGPLHAEVSLTDLERNAGLLSAQDAAYLRGTYLSEVAWADRAVGTLLAGLASRGLLDDALIVFTADHGEELLDRGWIGHSTTLHAEQVRVPLIFRLPEGRAESRRGSVIDAAVSLIDMPATVMELASGEDPGPGSFVHSRSLAPTVLEGREPWRRWLYLHTDFEPVIAEGAERKRALQWGVVDAKSRVKWIVDHKVAPGEAPKAHLYDLARDPLERVDLWGTPQSQSLSLPLRRLRALVPEPLDGRRGAPVELPEEPWIRKPADLDGAGPALQSELR